jgi:hypothetical protein
MADLQKDVPAIGEGPPKPQLCLTLGVTGHRPARLGPAHLHRIEELVSGLLAAMGTSVETVRQDHAASFATAPKCLRLVSALAEGADTLVAERAAAQGWRIDACLPFARATYVEDFPDGHSRERFDSLLAKATAIFAVPGARTSETVAYEAAGRVMLDQSDIVLALWDGDPARGRGGTAQIVAEAVARHIPVIHIDTRQPGAPELLWSGLSDLDLDQPMIESVARAPTAKVLEGVVTSLCAPPNNDIDRRMLRRFLHERDHKRTPALPYPLLLALTGVRAIRRDDARPRPPADCAQHLRDRTYIGDELGTFAAALNNKLLPRFGVADAAASYYAQIFRSSFVVNFGFAAFAVLLAACGLLFPALKLTLIAGELAIILLIIVNTRAGKGAGWHERWMDYRHLAEQLRLLAVTGLLGDLDLRPGDTGEPGAIPGWVRWLSRATAREIGLPSVVVDHVYLAKIRFLNQVMIQEQIEYHTGNSHQMRHLDHTLHRLGEYLFGGTVVACVFWIALKLVGLDAAYASFNVTALVTAITAALPAMGAALYGIRMHGDFGGIADRSDVTVKRLQRLQRALEADALEFDRLSARLRRFCEITLADVAHWRTTYQARPLILPG